MILFLLPEEIVGVISAIDRELLGASSRHSAVLSANNESSEVCGIINPGQKVKMNRSQALNVHQLLTIRFVICGPGKCHFAAQLRSLHR